MTETAQTVPPTISQVNRAGRRLRDVLRLQRPVDRAQVAADLFVVEQFRKLHAQPLKRVAVGLRYYVARHSTALADGRPVTAQRLKRIGTIVGKLQREPTMALSRMEDIGGCRALFANAEEVEGCVAQLRSQRRWRIVRERNYITEPKAESGYRAVHLVVDKDERRIEVQLRTLTQHAWAELVEAVDRDVGHGLKEGRAPADVTEYYRFGADLLAANESGEGATAEQRRRFRELHERIQQQALRGDD